LGQTQHCAGCPTGALNGGRRIRHGHHALPGFTIDDESERICSCAPSVAGRSERNGCHVAGIGAASQLWPERSRHAPLTAAQIPSSPIPRKLFIRKRYTRASSSKKPYGQGHAFPRRSERHRLLRVRTRREENESRAPRRRPWPRGGHQAPHARLNIDDEEDDFVTQHVRRAAPT
jgi:hypothetical protein